MGTVERQQFTECRKCRFCDPDDRPSSTDPSTILHGYCRRSAPWGVFPRVICEVGEMAWERLDGCWQGEPSGSGEGEEAG